MGLLWDFLKWPLLGGVGTLTFLFWIVKRTTKRCPQCAELVNPTARICPHCRSAF